MVALGPGRSPPIMRARRGAVLPRFASPRSTRSIASRAPNMSALFAPIRSWACSSKAGLRSASAMSIATNVGERAHDDRDAGRAAGRGRFAAGARRQLGFPRNIRCRRRCGDRRGLLVDSDPPWTDGGEGWPGQGRRLAGPGHRRYRHRRDPTNQRCRPAKGRGGCAGPERTDRCSTSARCRRCGAWRR